MYVGWWACEALISFFVNPETKGPTLAELSQLFKNANPTQNDYQDLERQASMSNKPVTALEESVKV